MEAMLEGENKEEHRVRCRAAWAAWRERLAAPPAAPNVLLRPHLRRPVRWPRIQPKAPPRSALPALILPSKEPQLSLSEGLQASLSLKLTPHKGSHRMATWQVLQQRVTYLQQVKPCVLAAAGSAQSLREKLAPGDREKLALGEATNKAKLANASEATKRAPLEFKKEGQSHATWTRRQHACRKYYLTWAALPGLTACTVGGNYSDLRWAGAPYLAEHLAKALRLLAGENGMCAMCDMLVHGKISCELQQNALAEMGRIFRFFSSKDTEVPNAGFDEAQEYSAWALGGMAVGCVASTAGKNHDPSSTQNPITGMQQRVLHGKSTATKRRRRDYILANVCCGNTAQGRELRETGPHAPPTMYSACMRLGVQEDDKPREGKRGKSVATEEADTEHEIALPAFCPHRAVDHRKANARESASEAVHELMKDLRRPLEQLRKPQVLGACTGTTNSLLGVSYAAFAFAAPWPWPRQKDGFYAGHVLVQGAAVPHFRPMA
jgi:hypothetical protein